LGQAIVQKYVQVSFPCKPLAGSGFMAGFLLIKLVLELLTWRFNATLTA
jgi:hypothetical protein